MKRPQYELSSTDKYNSIHFAGEDNKWNTMKELERNVPSNTNTHLLWEENNTKLMLHGATSLQGELIYWPERLQMFKCLLTIT